MTIPEWVQELISERRQAAEKDIRKELVERWADTPPGEMARIVSGIVLGEMVPIFEAVERQHQEEKEQDEKS